MKMSIFIPILIVGVLLFLIDAFVYRGIIQAVDKLPVKILKVLKWIYWLVPLVLLSLLAYVIVSEPADSPKRFLYVMFVIGGIALFYLPKLFFGIFQLSHDIWGVVQWVYHLFVPTPTVSDGNEISRSKFLLQLGLLASSVPFLGVAYGVIRGRFSFKVVEQPLAFDNLPKSFHGFKILQFSDAHLGSFIGNEAKIEKTIELMNAQKADIIVFTGDIVNNLANELESFIDIFAKLEAKHGKFSILGNHDYGTHHRWNSEEEKKANLELLCKRHQEMGFRLLRNENIEFEKDGEKIALVGVENWGLPPFPQYGELATALNGSESSSFHVLLSHDPSHWDAVVRKESQVDLTLSGHTHGMQFGIKIGSWQWSPVSIKYPRWSGLYQEGRQFLYVNQGFGVIGFPGRIGMDPELTLFELQSI